MRLMNLMHKTKLLQSIPFVITNNTSMICVKAQNYKQILVKSHYKASPFLRHYTNTLENISDLMDYANKEMFLTHHEESEESVTTGKLLSECNSIDDILQLIGDMYLSEKLWNEELLLYFNALVRALYACENHEQFNQVETEEMHLHILNHPHFQSLLRKTMLVSVYLRSTDLSLLLLNLGKIGVPLKSFVVNHAVVSLQKRINDFFPKDVAICYNALEAYDVGTENMRALKQGLLIHLENLSTDQEFFISCAADPKLKTFFTLVRYAGREASPHLKKCLILSCAESLKLRESEVQPLTAELAIKILRRMSYFSFQSRYIIGQTIKAIKQDDGNLSLRDKEIFSNSLQRLRLLSDRERQTLIEIAET